MRAWPAISRQAVRSLRPAIGLLFSLSLLALTSPAAAQGLVWNLPADGTEVRYQGTFKQTDTRAGGQETEMSWAEELLIRSVGTQQVDYNGQQVPGRWLEFESRTGKGTERGIEPGPLGTRIYKVLVPEPAITGKATDERGLPIAYLPITEGYVKEGDAAPRKLESNVFQPYPTLTLLMNYKPNEIKPEAENQSVTVPAGQYTATTYTAEATQESPAGRTINQATVAVSPDMPFGPVRWTATLTRESKDPNQPREAYAPASRIESAMEAREIRQGARSVLMTP